MTRKIPGESRREIVKMLLKHETMTYSEIKKKLEITDNAVSKHLSVLKKENKIEFKQEGKKKLYRLAKGADEEFDTQKVIFGEQYLAYLSGASITDIEKIHHLDDLTLSKLMYEISDNLSAFFLFIMLKSIETGRDWSEAFDLYEVFGESMDFLTYGMFGKNVDVEELRKLLRRDRPEYIKKIHQLSKNKKNNPTLELLSEILEERFPDQVDFLNSAINYSVEYEE